jgi:integrase/recombinase XerD
MLSPETLGLLRQWWKARPSRYDAGSPVAERWLFPGNKRGKPMTTRQLSRLFHEAAGIKKAMTLPRPGAIGAGGYPRSSRCRESD